MIFGIYEAAARGLGEKDFFVLVKEAAKPAARPQRKQFQHRESGFTFGQRINFHGKTNRFVAIPVSATVSLNREVLDCCTLPSASATFPLRICNSFVQLAGSLVVNSIIPPFKAMPLVRFRSPASSMVGTVSSASTPMK